MKTELKEEKQNEFSSDNYIPIRQIKIGNTYSQIFYVSNVDYDPRMVSRRAQSTFARITLKDTTGEITGTVWDYDESLRSGIFINASIKAHEYTGNLEFSVNRDKIQECGPPINLFDYVHGLGQYALDQHEDNIIKLSENIENDTYCNIIGYAIHTIGLVGLLKTSPHGLTGPLAFQGGLLVHTELSTRIALEAAETLRIDPCFNRSLVITGCLLRNIGWNTTTVAHENTIRPRDAYYMTGIERASQRFIDHLMREIESNLEIEISESDKQALENMCLPIKQINTVEGRLVASANQVADVVHGSSIITKQVHESNWHNEFFVGHNRKS
jgi:hypothetical protein